MLIALIDLIDEEAAVGQHVQEVQTAETPLEALTAGVRLTRAFQERCGDIIAALFSAAGAEPELADAVAEGQRRHREGARITIEQIDPLAGLRDAFRLRSGHPEPIPSVHRRSARHLRAMHARSEFEPVGDAR
jgi:hypothetical protein